MSDVAEESPRYAVRFSSLALSELVEASARLQEIMGSEEAAREWVVGIRGKAAELALNPRRYPILPIESEHLGFETRRFLSRRTSKSTFAYHLYYRVFEDGEDGPLVLIFHVRHAASKPMEQAEVEELRRDL